jgi:hypothetical protein
VILISRSCFIDSLSKLRLYVWPCDRGFVELFAAREAAFAPSRHFLLRSNVTISPRQFPMLPVFLARQANSTPTAGW